MKKILAFALSLSMVLSLAACGGGGNTSTPANNGGNTSTPAAGNTSTPASGDAIKAVYCASMNNESQAFAYKMFQKHEAEFGMKIDVLDDQGDAAKQAENVQQAAAQGYQWIIANPCDAAGLVTAFKAIKENNPDVLLSTYSADITDENYRDFFVGIDDTSAGITAANAFIEKFPNGCKMVEIGGQAGHNAQILRHDGFMSVMKDHPEFEILDCQNTEHWASDEAQAIAEDFVTKYGDDIEAVFCHWDNGATGVINALQAQDMNDVLIVAVDGCRAGFDQVTDGTQYATIMNNFETDSLDSMTLAQKVLNGEEVPSTNFIKMDIVTLDNINDFTAPEW